MDLNIVFTFTLSDRLFGLFEDKLPNLGRRTERTVAAEVKSQTRDETATSVSLTPPDSMEPVKTITLPETADKTKEPAPVKAVPAVPEKTFGEQVREIMHRTRQRFEGEDYKENGSSELRKKYHKPMNDMFKLIAATLGYEKPSYIDNAEKIEAFARECETLILDENGLIAYPKAPF